MSTVTVVIPTLTSRGNMLSEALASVQSQVHTPDAVVIVYDHEHEGAAATRNKALAMVQTDYVAFLDDDDWLLPDHLRLLIDTLESTDSDLAYPWFEGGQNWISAPWNGERISPYQRAFGIEQKEWMLNNENFIPITFLVKTELAKKVGGFPAPDKLRGWLDAEDYAFLRLLLNEGARFVHAPHKTWVWRMHDGRTSDHQ